MQARMLIFGMQVDDDLLYRGIENQPSLAYLSLYLPNFLSYHTLMKFFVKDFSATTQGRMLIFGMHVDDDLLYCGIENQSSPAYSSLYLCNFLSFRTLMKFSSKISQEPCKVESSSLVCRLLMTCCIVGLKTSLLLLILPCICPIFFPSIL